MVAKAEIYEVADRMVARGEVPKNREVREQLERKGSLEDIQPVLSQWRQDRRYKAAIASLDLCDEEAKALAKAVLTLRASFVAKGTSGGPEVSNLSSSDANAVTISKLTAEVAVLSEENARLRMEAEGLRASSAVPVPLKPTRGEGERSRGAYAATQRFFWNAVMREIYARLDGGPKSSSEIFRLIPPDTRLMVQMLGNKELDEEELVSQIRKRVSEGYYFIEVSELLFLGVAAKRGDDRYLRHAGGRIGWS
jgi:hypothetical protein